MANDLRAFDIVSPSPSPGSELSHAGLEIVKRAAARADTPEQKAALVRHIATSALQMANCPEITENRIAAVVSHLIVVDEIVPDPRETLPASDNAARKLIVSSVRVADKDGKPRTVGSLLTGVQEDFPISRLIDELRAPYPLEHHQSKAKLDVASRLAW